jgi:hypothetical protein
MPRKDYGEGEQPLGGQPASEQPAGSANPQPGTGTPTPAEEQLMTTLNQVFSKFRQQSLDQPTTVFDEDARKAVGEFNDILSRLRFRNPIK